jgi:hypothetical protein
MSGSGTIRERQGVQRGAVLGVERASTCATGDVAHRLDRGDDEGQEGRDHCSHPTHTPHTIASAGAHTPQHEIQTPVRTKAHAKPWHMRSTAGISWVDKRSRWVPTQQRNRQSGSHITRTRTHARTRTPRTCRAVDRERERLDPQERDAWPSRPSTIKAMLICITKINARTHAQVVFVCVRKPGVWT